MTISQEKLFSTEQKILARTKLIYHCSGTAIHRVFTLAGQHGFCAKAFRKAWKNVEIIGIERSQRIANASMLVQPYSNVLDELYCITLGGMIAGRTPLVRLRRQLVKTIPPRHSQVPTKNYDYGMFDVAFLDFCGTLDKHEKDVIGFCKQYLNVGGIAGITFCLGSGKTKVNSTPEEIARSVCAQAGLDFLEAYPYLQGKTKMLTFYGKKL